MLGSRLLYEEYRIVNGGWSRALASPVFSRYIYSKEIFQKEFQTDVFS